MEKMEDTMEKEMGQATELIGDLVKVESDYEKAMRRLRPKIQFALDLANRDETLGLMNLNGYSSYSGYNSGFLVNNNKPTVQSDADRFGQPWKPRYILQLQ